MALLESILLLVAAAADAATEQNHLDKFTLNCASLNPDAPLKSFMIDVNLPLMSYYADIGGLDQIQSFDNDGILFRRTSRFEHTVMFSLERFDRKSGFLYFSDSLNEKPGASCSVERTRLGFNAKTKYHSPLNR